MKRTLVIGLTLIGFAGVCVASALIAQQPAQKKQSESPRTQERGSSHDSRAFGVEKPCTADEVTITAGETGVGKDPKDCEEAKRNCRGDLAKNIAAAAEKECKTYQKIADQAAQCHAHRGNFDPTKGTKYEECHFVGTGQEVKCSSKVDVQYSCN